MKTQAILTGQTPDRSPKKRKNYIPPDVEFEVYESDTRILGTCEDAQGYEQAQFYTKGSTNMCTGGNFNIGLGAPIQQPMIISYYSNNTTTHSS